MHAQCILSPCICKFSKKDSLKSKKLNVESELITSKLFILGIQNQREREIKTADNFSYTHIDIVNMWLQLVLSCDGL